MPNAGKSTLINALVGSNVCAASSKVQTTVRNSLAVYTKDDAQIVFQDTPGIVTEEELVKPLLKDFTVSLGETADAERVLSRLAFRCPFPCTPFPTLAPQHYRGIGLTHP